MTKIPTFIYLNTLVYLTPILFNLFVIFRSHLNWIQNYIDFKFKKKKTKITKLINILITRNILIFLLVFELTSKFFYINYMSSTIILLLLINIYIFYSLDIAGSSNNSAVGFNYFVILPVILVLKSFGFVSNFLVLLVLIELINYIFYFQFLGFSYKKNKNNKFKQFDAILIYFWSTFISLILLVIWLIYYIQQYNTTNFSELQVLYLVNKQFRVLNTILLVALLIKFGAIGAHFLKAEIYKSLNMDSIILFSIITLFVYIQILHFLLDNLFVIFLDSYRVILFFLLLVSSITILTAIPNNNLLNILAISSVVNMSILLILNLT